MNDKQTAAEMDEFNDPIEAIKFYMAERGLKQRDLVPMIGSRSKVSEILSGSRMLTMPMARALHQHLGIPAEVLLKEPDVHAGTSEVEIDWRRFPLREMAKRDWIEKRGNLRDNAEELVTRLMRKAGCIGPTAVLYHKTDQNRANAKTDPYALNAWCWQVLAQANNRDLRAEYQEGSDHAELLNQVAKLSPAIDGPRQAVDFLAMQGISVEIVPHLPRTHLDGAAMKSVEGCPVIGLTLRYDRIDNFWWVLMHELAHVALHLSETNEAIVDDLQLTATSNGEKEADDFAYNCLISEEIWYESGILENPSPMAVIGLAQEAGVHPAIVAGRARHELENYRLLSQFVGTGEVRPIFGL